MRGDGELLFVGKGKEKRKEGLHVPWVSWWPLTWREK